MLITHTTNAFGHRRLYLGGKSSLECWIEPAADGIAWSFHMAPAVTGNPLTVEQQRQSAIALLLALADELAVPTSDLKAVPFERIAALHSSNPFDHHRVAVPKQKLYDHCYMAARPNVTRPAADFHSADYVDGHTPRSRR